MWPTCFLLHYQQFLGPEDGEVDTNLVPRSTLVVCAKFFFLCKCHTLFFIIDLWMCWMSFLYKSNSFLLHFDPCPDDCKLSGPKISKPSLELLEILVCFQFFYRTWPLDIMDQHPIFRGLACNWRKSFHFWINRVKTYFLYSFISVKI